jgi:D-alanyl-D-alanine carboxypeptidase (penicillin-binding protein 5/6)
VTVAAPRRRRWRALPVALALALVAAVAPARPGTARIAPVAVGAAVDLAPPPTPAAAEVPDGWPAPPAATAAAYLLLDARTGQVLAARNPDQARPVASTVKILTALTVLDRTTPSDVVVVPPAAAAVGGASVGLAAGDRWTVAELLDGLVARSGNDAATALAIHVAGSVEAFVELMRRDAAALGLDEVVLASPSGLEDANRLSPRDLATVARVAMATPGFRAAAGRARVTLPGGRVLASRNELLERYPGATGIKTGFTEAAGYSLVASAAREGRELIAVVLASRGPDDRFDDAAALLDFGFDRLTTVEVAFDATLAVAGGSVALSSPALPVTVPVDAAVTTTVLPLPVEAPTDGGPRPAGVVWQGTELARLQVTTTAPARPEATGAAGLGRHLVDRAYAAMRAATTTGAWRG